MHRRGGRVLRKALKALWFQALYRFGAVYWAQWKLRRTGSILVLNFHRVLSPAEFETTNSPAGMIVRTQTFTDCLSFLSTRYEFIDLHDHGKLERRSLRLAITFDDGWEDNYRNAAPVLSNIAAPACIFLCPGKIATASPYWPETAAGVWNSALGDRAGLLGLQAIMSAEGREIECDSLDLMLDSLKQMNPAHRDRVLSRLTARFPPFAQVCDKTMGWEEIRLLRKKGFHFGSHTMHHEILTTLCESQMDAELLTSRRKVANETGEDVPLFSYPNGDWNPVARNRVAAAGYKLAFTNSSGVWFDGTDLLIIPRINLNENKITGIGGKFSAAAMSYYVFWQPYRVWKARSHKASVEAGTM
jgi:peptidoglycan/xylan/chitin deacetylase (PgdA/CDA1 family)